MLRSPLVFAFLLIPAALILLSGRAGLGTRFLWAVASFGSGLLLLAGAMVIPVIGDEMMPAPVRGVLGMVLLLAGALMPWALFVGYRRAKMHPGIDKFVNAAARTR